MCGIEYKTAKTRTKDVNCIIINKMKVKGIK